MQGSARCITFLLVSGSLVWFVGSQPSHALQTGQDPADPVEAYLLKLGLTDHALEYLENELVKRPNREPLARELATLYTTKILELHSQAQVEEIQKKVRILLGKYPSIRTPQLETILLQADFTRAEGEFAKWVFDPEDAKSRTTAGDTFGRIGGEFKSHAIVLEAAKQKIENEIEKTKDGPERAAKMKTAERLAQEYGRAAYFSAWSHYYLAQIKGLDRGDAAYQQAKGMFRKLVPFDGPPDNADPDELGLLSTNRARSVLGLALVEMAMGETAKSEGWFRLLRDSRVDDEVRGGVDFWQLYAVIQAGSAEQAIGFARQRASALGESTLPGTRNFYKLLVVKGGSQKGLWAPLAEVGLEGLVRLKLPDMARALVAKYQITIGSSSFAGRLLSASGLLDGAEKSKLAGDYKKAADALLAALPLCVNDPGTGARLRYQAGYCLFKTNDWPGAIGLLEEAVKGMGKDRSELAGDALWLLVTAYEKQLLVDPSIKTKRLEALREFSGNFPNHSRIKNAQALLALGDGPIPALDMLKPEDPAYAEKVYLLVKKAYGEWRAVRGDASKAAGALVMVQSAAGRYLALPEKSVSTGNRLEVAFMAADSFISGSPNQFGPAGDLLRQIEPSVKLLPVEARAASDYRILQLQLGQATGNVGMAKEASEWICMNRAGSPLHEAALIGYAKTADAFRLKGIDKTKSQQEALVAYKNLVSFYGDTPEKVKTNRNAQIANFRLAEQLYAAGDMEGCASILEKKLLTAFPKETKYLRLMGMAGNHGRNLDKSLECWRLLTVGLPSGSNEWFEAKYNHMANLSVKSVEDARLAFNHFKVLHPELGPEKMRAQFLELEAKLAK